MAKLAHSEQQRYAYWQGLRKRLIGREVVTYKCDLVVMRIRKDKNEYGGRSVADWELYFGAFFKFLTISWRVATVVEIYQFVITDTQNSNR